MTTLARTAYEESLSLAGTEEETQTLLPSYMVAADTHNIANRNQTFLESAVDLVETVPKFIGLSLISGVNQIYNIPADVGNLFGADYERNEIDDFIAGVDSDLGAYYQEHKEGVDTLGFVASSMVPGLGGIKALHAGQSALKASIAGGKFGENTSRALGLLVPAKEKHLKKAISEAINSNSVISLTERNTLLSMRAGLGQNVLEAAAFETAVAATLFDSPVLEGQDLGDFVSNIAWGAGVFGAVGGVVDITRGYFQIRKAVKIADAEAMPWRYIADAPEKANSYEKIALDFDQMHGVPDIPTNVDEARQVFLKNSADEKVVALELRVRKEIGTLSNGDQAVAEALYQTTKAASLESKLGAYIGLKGSTRLTEKSAIEAETLKIQKKIQAGTADIADAERLGNLHVAYARTWGDDAGKVFTEQPRVVSLVDSLKKGEVIKVSATGVKAGKKNYPFKLETKGKKAAWDVTAATPLQAQARYIWASKLPEFPKSTLEKPIVIAENDLPLLEKAYREFDSTFKLKMEDGTAISFPNQENFLRFLVEKKEQLANKIHFKSEELLAKEVATATPSAAPTRKITQEEISSMVNVKNGYLGGEQSANVIDDVFALQKHSEDYTARMIQQGSHKEKDGLIDVWNVPQHVKLTYDSTPFAKLNGHEVENMVVIKQQQKLYMQATDRASASVIGAEHVNLPVISAKDIQDTANRIGAGAHFATAASSNYGTLAALTEYIGKTTIRIIEKAQGTARESLEPALYKLGQNPEAAIEWSALSATLRSIPDNYVLNEAGDALRPQALVLWERKAAEAAELGKKVPEKPVLKALDAPENIPLKSAEVQDLAKIHIELNGKRVESYRTLRTSQGVSYKTSSDIFYAPPVDPKEFPFFALVSDSSITGTGHTKTIYAATEQELETMVAKLKTDPKLTVRVKKDAEDYYKSIGQFDFEKTLNDNYLDTTMHRKGVSSPHFVPTDPNKIVSDLLNWHLQKESGLVREAVATKYEVPFAELRNLGSVFTKLATSKFSSASLVKYADDVVKNPYADFIKTSLGIRKYSDYPFWINANRMADEAVSKMYARATGAMESAKTPAELVEVNKILDQAGYKGAAYDEGMDLFANHQAAKGLLTTTVQKANSILATIVLRWDTLNAANNAISANVLLGAETKAVLRAIESSDANAIGKLAEIGKISVPGTDKLILAPQKLIAASMQRFGTNTPQMQFYRDHGYISSISDQYRKTLDDLTFNAKESVEGWNSRVDGVHKTLREAANTGEKWTGNRLAEEFNRFVAADVMKQITDIAVDAGKMTGQEQLAYINTFVNRTQGNYLAAQRPMMFQGPVGQAIGLFQTYQFNLMQQLLRHVGEGSAKDAATLLALQGTIHGMNGLPAFNAINTHIVGNASGNTDHRDLIDTIYGAAGKQAGNWLMYGLGSNWLLHPDLKVNLYVRGDINPRHLTIVPTDPSQVPIVQATGKFIANLFETGQKLAAGGDVATTLLQGLEHNGISRPLAGLAQTLEATVNPLGVSYSTSKKGNVIASNDLLSLANLGRIIGGKPLDEAIAQDATFRFKAYGLEDSARRRRLGEAMKTSMIAGQEPSTEQINNFAEQYAALGGKQDQFNTWFTQLYKTANLSQANKLSQDLNGKFSQGMQRIMGGAELRDFTE